MRPVRERMWLTNIMLSCTRAFERSGIKVQLERLALKRAGAAFFVASEGEEDG